MEGAAFGDILSAPIGTYRPGEQVRVVFCGTKPSNHQRRNSTFVEVEIQRADDWKRVADDGDWATKLSWQKLPKGRSRVTVTWDIPPDVDPGIYRIRYLGDAADFQGRLTAFEGTTAPFTVTRAGAVTR
jgi:neutral ceramidase